MFQITDIFQIIDFVNVFNILIAFLLSSIFPLSMIAYQIFQRDKQLKELEKDFEVLGISTTIPKTNQSGKIFFLSFIVQTILPTLLTILGVIMIFTSPGEVIKGLGEVPLVITSLKYGFLGAYLYSIQLIYRRYTTLDLQPTVYMNCALTLIAGFAFNFTAFRAINEFNGPNEGGITTGMFAIIAFSLGYFPLLAIRWFNQITASALGSGNQSQATSLPLSVIDGISQFHESRLRDEGIDNVQNLASARIDEILINTRFNAQQVLEWVDQAILHSYLNPDSIDSFRRGGVRKISDFQDIWAPYYFEPVVKNSQEEHAINKIPDGLPEARTHRALQLQSTPEYLDALYQTSLAGPNIAYIESYWKNQKTFIRDLTTTAVENAKKEAKSTIAKSLTKIFEEIGKLEINDDERPKLGNIANILAPDPAQFVSDEDLLPQTSEGLLGLAWWLWWLNINDESNNFTNQASAYYEKAITDSPDNPKYPFETSAFYLLQSKDYEKAQTYAEQAIKLSAEKDENGLLSNSLALLVLINKQNGNSNNGEQPVEATISQLVEGANGSNGEGSDFEYLQEIPQKINEAFSGAQLPEDGSELQNIISSVLEGNLNEHQQTG